MPNSTHRHFEIPDPLNPQTLRHRRNHLLAIGIDSYADPNIPDLSNPVRDTKAIVEVLYQQYQFEGTDIHEFYDADAHGDAIINALVELKSQVGKHDNLLIYLAGHGHYDKEFNMGYLIPADGNRNSRRSMITHGELRDYIRAIDGHHIFLIVDACFSGNLLVRNRELDTKRLSEAVDRHPSRWALAVGRIEAVEDGLRGNHSPFANSVLQFLRTTPQSPFPASELIQYVKRVTPRNARQTPIGAPLFQAGDLDGEFVFHRRLEQHRFWSEAEGQRTPAAYQQYLSLFPQGHYLELAHWRLAELTHTIRAYYQYRKQHPGGTYYEEALKRIRELEEDQVWTQTKREDSLSAYEAYRDRFPTSKYLQEAQVRIDALLDQDRKREAQRTETEFWRQVSQMNTSESYQQYIDRYPQGSHIHEAKQRLKSFRKDQELREEKAFWEEVQHKNTPEGYAEYLKRYHQGQFAPEAQLRKKALEAAQIHKQKPIDSASGQQPAKPAVETLLSQVWSRYRVCMVSLQGIWDWRIDHRITGNLGN